MLGKRRQARGRVGWGAGWGRGSPGLAGPLGWGTPGAGRAGSCPEHSQVSLLLSLESPHPLASSASLAALAGGEAPSPQQPGMLRGQGTELCGQRIMETPPLCTGGAPTLHRRGWAPVPLAQAPLLWWGHP